MKSPEKNIVTGSFGFTGKSITRRLLASGKGVLTLTGHPERPNPFGDQVRAAPFNFNNPEELIKSLRGATTLYNTYWIRFDHGTATYKKAVENTRVLINAAEQAGIHRIVHISIANADVNSPLPYFKGKGLIEKAILESKLSYAILRPTVIFGDGGILINNIAWLLRRLPLFAIPGSGSYKLQPIYVEDLAELAVNLGNQKNNTTVDAIGQETFTFEELVRLIREKVRSRSGIIHLRPSTAYLLSKLMGYLVKDVVLTKDEVAGLMANLLVSENPPTGKTKLSEWLEENKNSIGLKYASELGKHYRK